jgi:chromosome segregation ATPase
MDTNLADPAGTPDPRTPLRKWVEEMQTVTRTIAGLIEDSERHRAIAESAHRDHEALQDELSRVRGAVDRLEAEAEQQRAELERARSQAEQQRTELEHARSQAEQQRADLERVRTQVEQQRAEADRQRAVAEGVERERDALRAELAALHNDNDRLRTEQVEAGETAAKLLGEMKELVNQVAHKFQGSSKSSPFAREPRSPQS